MIFLRLVHFGFQTARFLSLTYDCGPSYSKQTPSSVVITVETPVHAMGVFAAMFLMTCCCRLSTSLMDLKV
jgi:hypothetical protein